MPLFVPLGHRPDRKERHGDAPLRRPHTISSRVCTGNYEWAIRTLQNPVYKTVLRKRHSRRRKRVCKKQHVEPKPPILGIFDFFSKATTNVELSEANRFR
jgi:hypothetical protein